MKVVIGKDLERGRKQIAGELRSRLDSHQVLALNLIGSPGCGKTSLLEATLPEFKKGFAVTVVEGDIATQRDARRIEAVGVPCVQINTGGTCHVSVTMLAKALEQVDLNEVDLLFVENVGNLVCPSTLELGEHAKVAVISVPEGDDKVLKYPRLFREAPCVVLNKIDLLEGMDFDVNVIKSDLEEIKHGLPLFEVSARTGEGCDKWIEWVRSFYQQKFRPEPHVGDS